MSEYRSWFRQHASAMVMLLFFIVSVGLFALGTVWGERDPLLWKHTGILLTQIAGTIFAALLAILFFNLDDVRSQIATTAAALLTSGELIHNLSSRARETLDTQLVLHSLAPDVLAIEPTLLSWSNRIRASSLACHHLYNFYQEIAVEPHSGDSRLVIRRHVRHFRVKASHLHPRARTFPLKYYLEVGLPDDLELSPGDVLQEFQIIAGQRTLTRDDAVVASDISGTTPVVTITCSCNLDVVDEMDVRITVATLGSIHDNTELYIARYPVYGLNLIFRYREDLLYDCAWFKHWLPESGYQPGRANHRKIPSGIMAYTNDWVLPGEGVAFSWYTGRKKVVAPPMATLVAASVAEQS